MGTKYPVPSNETPLVFDEGQFRDYVANLLRQDTYKTQIEVQLPGRFRVDILAEKEGVTKAIEVKREAGGIPDDIIKCQKLLRLPEVTEAYVAAPEFLISPDHVAFATSIGVGVVAVSSSELKWLVQSHRLEPPRLAGSRTTPSVIAVGEIFEIKVGVRNDGQKIAQGLEARCLPAGPFVFAPGSKRKYNRLSLDPDDSWVVQFLIRVRPNTKKGAYPLFTTITAQNATPSQSTLSINVRAPDSKEV